MIFREPRCCGYFGLRSVVLGVAVYYVFLSLLALVWEIVEVIKCGGWCPGPMKSPSPITYSLPLVLLLLSLCLLFGVLRRRPGLLLPFLAYQIIDFLGSLLIFCGLFFRFPYELRALNSWSRQEEERYVTVAVHGGAVLQIAVSLLLLLLKIYLIRCVLTYYRYLLTRISPPPGEPDGLALLVVPAAAPEKNPLLLPSYEEALTMPGKDSPPPPYTQAAPAEQKKEEV